MPSPATWNKILIVALSRIGDAVCATPVIRELKNHYKNAKIDLVCLDYMADVFRMNPYISEIHPVQKGWSKLWKIGKLLKPRGYTLALDLTADDKVAGALLGRWSGAKYCIGYQIRQRGFCLDETIDFAPGRLHAATIFLQLLTPLKIPILSKKTEIFISEEEKDDIEQLLHGYGLTGKDFIVGLHPGGNFPSQRLSSEKWAQFCDKVQDRYAKKVVLFGGQSDEHILDEIFIRATQRPIVLNKLLKLRTTIALISRCNILACNNSGPLHIAAALGIPTISWMGPTISYRWYPLGPNNRVIRKDVACSPCNRGKCDHHKCEMAVTLDDMEQAFQELLGKI